MCDSGVGYLGPSLHLESVSDSHAYPRDGGWVAPVLKGQGQQITMIVMAKLTSSQAGSDDHGRMVDLVI